MYRELKSLEFISWTFLQVTLNHVMMMVSGWLFRVKERCVRRLHAGEFGHPQSTVSYEEGRRCVDNLDRDLTAWASIKMMRTLRRIPRDAEIGFYEAWRSHQGISPVDPHLELLMLPNQPLSSQMRRFDHALNSNVECPLKNGGES